MKDFYKQVCAQENSIPLFSQPWWLDATVGSDNWDVLIVKKDGELLASMPYTHKNKLGFTISIQPPLTQNMGPWLSPCASRKRSSIISHQHKLLTMLLDQLPHHDYLVHNWHWHQTNWLPFYWRGFQQTTRYTYILPELSDLNQVWSGFHKNLKWEIGKAQKRFRLEVIHAELNSFLPLYIQTFERQKLIIPHPPSLIEKLDKACMERAQRRIFLARDDEGVDHAAVYLVWDSNSAYYLMGGSNPDLRNSGAMSLCMWEAIQFAASVSKKFDFEGSMLQQVERYFRSFGAVQTPYFCISRTNSPLLKIYQFLKLIQR